MIYAKNEEGNRIKATTGTKGYCFVCGERLTARCGNTNVWHWSHSTKTECESSGKMTKWHMDWQEKFKEENREIIIPFDGGYKIADIKLDNGLVIEFQHSPISEEEILKRESVYDNMIWVLDYTEKPLHLYLDRENENEFNAIFKNFKKSFLNATKPIYINFKDNYLYSIDKKAVLEVVNGKTRILHKNDVYRIFYDENRPNPIKSKFICNVIEFERKILELKKAIENKENIFSMLDNDTVLNWWIKYNSSKNKDNCLRQ